MTLYKGIIFDFNGTLYWDSAKHKQAWREYSKKLRGTPFTDEEMIKYMFGRTNEQIISYAISKQPTPQMVKELGDEKEAVYRQMCLDDAENFHLAEGAEEFLDFLKDNNIPRTIATMSDKNNVDLLGRITQKPDVIIDFSTTDATFTALNYAVKELVPIVIATTGFSIEDENKILEYSEAIPIFKSSNMSYGIHLFSDLVSKFSKKLNDVKINMDIEIIEKHHRRKVDAPSRYCPYDS